MCRARGYCRVGAKAPNRHSEQLGEYVRKNRPDGAGFTLIELLAVIRSPLYRDGERPKEKFKAMKYFHMGHRLKEVVKRERELIQTD
ncbi:MAG: prepilin-type N-terminal cleavage/methylation domain-containing protein [Planctomycetota bacterium]